MQTIGLPTVASERTSQPAPSFLYVRTYAHHITQKRVVVFRFASVICNIYFLCDCCCCICVSHMICAYLWLRLAAYTNNALWLIYQRGVSASFLTGYEVGFRFGMAKLGWTHGKRWTKNVQKSWILFLGRLGTHVRRYHSAYCITCMAILADDLVIDFYDGCNRHTYEKRSIRWFDWQLGLRKNWTALQGLLNLLTLWKNAFDFCFPDKSTTKAHKSIFWCV